MTSKLEYLIRIDLSPQSTQYETQQHILYQLKSITKNLSLESITEEVDFDVVRKLFVKWNRFYIEHYGTMYAKADKTTIDPKIQKRFPTVTSESKNEDRWKRDYLKKLNEPKNKKKIETKNVSENGMMNVKFTDALRAMVDKKEGETTPTIEENTTTTSIVTPMARSKFDIFESVVNRFAGQKGIPVTTIVDRFSTDKSAVSELTKLYDEESQLFGRFAENKISIIMCVELLKLRSLYTQYEESKSIIDEKEKETIHTHHHQRICCSMFRSFIL
jgi:hypothetical protein